MPLGLSSRDIDSSPLQASHVCADILDVHATLRSSRAGICSSPGCSAFRTLPLPESERVPQHEDSCDETDNNEKLL